MKHFAIGERNLEFKNLLSGPAPIGRMLNYIYSAGTDRLFHKNGYRSLDFNGNIGSAWATEFMIGLELVCLGSSVGDKTVLVLTERGKRLFGLIQGNYRRFSEDTNSSGIARVKHEINACNPELYNEIHRMFVTSVPYQILREYLNDYGYYYHSRDTFMDDLFECVKNAYDTDVTPFNRNSRVPTSRNRVPSLLQLCELFDMVVCEGQTLSFLSKKINVDVSDMSYSYSAKEVQAAIEKDRMILVDFDAVLQKYGVDGTVLVEAVVRNGALQKVFKHNLMVGQRGKCAICGMENPELLVGSHIKPAANSNAAEKADHNNGLLLCCNHDKLFDRHLITFNFLDGQIQISKSITDADKIKLGLSDDIYLSEELLTEERAAYLMLHNIEFTELEENR